MIGSVRGLVLVVKGFASFWLVGALPLGPRKGASPKKAHRSAQERRYKIFVVSPSLGRVRMIIFSQTVIETSSMRNEASGL